MASGCKKDLEPQDASGNPAASPAPEMQAQNVAPQIAPTPPQQPVGQTTAVTPGQVTQVANGMNPPHGQPNHRCDIPVGAPLNSPPGKTAAMPNKPTMTINPAKPQMVASNVSPGNPGVTAPGMNPPHGQPGHRCDVGVGMPLPATPTPAPATSAAPNQITSPEITVSEPKPAADAPKAE